MLINDNIEIKNYIGDDFQQRKAQYNINNNIEVPLNNSDLRDKVAATLDDADIFERYDSYMEGIPKKKIEIQKSKEEEEDEVINNLKKLNKKRGKEEEEADEEEIDNLKQFTEEIKKTKIIYNDMKYLKNVDKDKYKDALAEMENFDKYMAKWEPYLEVMGEFIYTKISVTQIFKEVIPNHLNSYKWVKEQIKKKMEKRKQKDYPTDFCVSKWNPELYNELLKARSKNPQYDKEFSRIKQMVVKFYEGEYQDFQCDVCHKFVANKKRHCLHCPEFKQKLEEEGEKKLKKFIENNYKKINLLDVDKILEEFKGKKTDYICENLPRIIKNWKKIQKNKIEKAERSRANKVFKRKSAGTLKDWKKMIAQIKKEIDEEDEKEKKKPKKNK